MSKKDVNKRTIKSKQTQRRWTDRERQNIYLPKRQVEVKLHEIQKNTTKKQSEWNDGTLESHCPACALPFMRCQTSYFVWCRDSQSQTYGPLDALQSLIALSGDKRWCHCKNPSLRRSFIRRTADIKLLILRGRRLRGTRLATLFIHGPECNGRCLFLR